MKYVITDRGDVAVGGSFHFQMAKALKGHVVAAGHYRLVDEGRRVEVFGQSYAFHIQARPADAIAIARYLGLPSEAG
jgi:hypothetical protein